MMLGNLPAYTADMRAVYSKSARLLSEYACPEVTRQLLVSLLTA
jgi:hypothetical protein